MPYIPINLGGNVDAFLRGVDIKLKQVANQQGGSITDADSLNDVLASLQVKYGELSNFKARQKVMSKMLTIQNQQQKLSAATVKDDSQEVSKGWDNLKVELAHKYPGDLPGLITNLAANGMQAMNTLEYKAWDYYQKTGEPTLINSYAATLQKMDESVKMYQDIYSGLEQDQQGNWKVRADSANRLNGYGVFYKTDTQGGITGVDIKRVAASDANKQIAGVNLYGIGVYFDSDPIKVGDKFVNKIGNLQVSKDADNESYTAPSGTDFNSLAPSLSIANRLGNLLQNAQTGQIYKYDDESKQWHPVDKKTFDGFTDGEKQMLTPMPDSYFKANIVGNVGKDYKTYVRDTVMAQVKEQATQSQSVALAAQANVERLTGALRIGPPSVDVLGLAQKIPAIKKATDYITQGGKYVGGKLAEEGKKIFEGLWK